MARRLVHPCGFSAPSRNAFKGEIMRESDAHSARASGAAWLIVIAALGLTLGSARLAAQEKAAPAPGKESGAKPEEPKPGEYNNSVTVGVGHTFIEGDKAQFLRRTQLPGGTFGGVEELHFEQIVGQKGLFQIDGA